MRACKPDSAVGILLLDKPLGLSSNQALQRVRRLFGGVSAGHTGSLDPLATGMLPICLGEATKVAGLLLGGRKAYEADIALGRRTSTGDTEGEIVEERAVPELPGAFVEERLATHIGTSQQRPPMHSAIHVGGVRLYELARRGIEVERPARPIEIYAIELLGLEPARLTVRVSCSTGTYIRTLAEAVAESLGTVGHVTRLQRLWVEPFAGEPMHTLESLGRVAAGGPEALAPLVLPIERSLAGLMEIRLDADAARRLAHGQKVPAGGVAGLHAVYGPDGELLGLGGLGEDGLLQARRLFTWAIGSKACAQKNAVESE